MPANTYGRQVVVASTNKSGGGVIAGDVVVMDTANNDAFTTTTSANSTAIVGIAQETIASNAVGRVLLSGYAALVNVNASVTRGHYGATHTVAKQAADFGAARGAGTFCQFLTGGTTPDAVIWPTDLGGASVNVTTKGDVQGYDTAPARIPVGSNGQILTADSTQALGLKWGAGPDITSTTNPELLAASGGSDISLSGATTGTGVTLTASGAGWLINFTNASWQRCDVASAVGTGDFDYRARILAVMNTSASSSSAAPLPIFGVSDSVPTEATRLSIRCLGHSQSTTLTNNMSVVAIDGVAVSGTVNNQIVYPLILRIKRVGTAVTRYFSFTEGATWAALTGATSSLNVARVGFYMNPNGATSADIFVHWIRSY